MADFKLPGFLKRLATGRNSARRTRRPVQNINRHFTKRALNSLNLAGEEAQSDNSGKVEVVHLLLVLTKHPADLTTRFLACYKITPAFLQANLQPSPALTGQIDDLPDAYLQKVIDLAAAIALRLDHPYIGTEHILLGIFEEESQISRICRSLNLNIPELKEQFLILLQKPEYQPFAYR